jgi:hypothetical protein
MKWIASVAIATSVLLTGCGEDTNEACAYGVQQDLDTGNFQGVIDQLGDDSTCGGEYTQDEASMNLAAAYMGTAGLTMGNLLGAVLDSNSSDAMTSFMTSFASAATSKGLSSLDKASDLYAGVFGIATCDGNESGLAADACFYNGLVVLTQSVGTLTAVLGDAVEFLTEPVTQGSIDDVNDNISADEIEVTACAVAEANVTDGTCDTPANGSVTYTDTALVTFGVGTSGQISLLPRKFDIADLTAGTTFGTQSYYRLINSAAIIPSPVTTSGTCDVNYTSSGCAIDNVSCFPCPIVIDGNTSTVTSDLLDIINDPTSLESLTAYLPSDDNGTDANITGDLIQSIEDAAGINSDGVITEDELAAYLLTL